MLKPPSTLSLLLPGRFVLHEVEGRLFDVNGRNNASSPYTVVGDPKTTPTRHDWLDNLAKIKNYVTFKVSWSE